MGKFDVDNWHLLMINRLPCANPQAKWSENHRSIIFLVKMFWPWFITNTKFNITSTALKLYDFTDDLMN